MPIKEETVATSLVADFLALFSDDFGLEHDVRGIKKNMPTTRRKHNLLLMIFLSIKVNFE